MEHTVDESGVYLLPAVLKTWAPRGQTLVLHHRLTNDHVATITVSPGGDLSFQVQRRAYDSAAVLTVIDAQHATVRGKLLVIWAGAPIHRSEHVAAYLTTHRHGLQVEVLPGYAPDLHPDAGI